MRWLSTAARTGISSNCASAAAASRPIAVLAIAAIDDERRLEVFLHLPRLADQLHRVGGRPHVVGRGLDGDQHHVAGQDRRAAELVDARRAIDDHDVVVAGEPRQVAVQRRLRHAHDRERRFAFARARPRHRAALRVGVNQKDTLARTGEARRQVDRDGRFADPAFLIENADDHQDALLKRGAGASARSPLLQRNAALQ